MRLAWDDLPEASVVLDKLERFLTQIDSQGWVMMDVADTTSKKTVKRVDTGEYPVIGRWSQPTKRTMNSKTMVRLCPPDRDVAHQHAALVRKN